MNGSTGKIIKNNASYKCRLFLPCFNIYHWIWNVFPTQVVLSKMKKVNMSQNITISRVKSDNNLIPGLYPQFNFLRYRAWKWDTWGKEISGGWSSSLFSNRIWNVSRSFVQTRIYVEHRKSISSLKSTLSLPYTAQSSFFLRSRMAMNWSERLLRGLPRLDANANMYACTLVHLFSDSSQSFLQTRSSVYIRIRTHLPSILTISFTIQTISKPLAGAAEATIFEVLPCDDQVLFFSRRSIRTAYAHTFYHAYRRCC